MSALKQRKLKVTSSAPVGAVYVFQDGSNIDVDADYQFDDAFRLGAQKPDTTAAADRYIVEVTEIANEYDQGRTLTFRYASRDSWRDFSFPELRPNSTVEFFAEVPTQATSVGTAAWHINEATPGDQVRLFFGWISTVDSGGDGWVTVECVDALQTTNDVVLMRDTSNGISIPHIAFNVDRDSDEYLYSVKATDRSGPVVYGIGETVQSDNAYRMTVGEILDYLQSAYQTELTLLGAWPDSGDLIPSADLTGLDYRPSQIVLQNVGFADGVRQIIKWCPDRRLTIDHQTKKWRLAPVARALTEVEGSAFGVNINPGPAGGNQGRLTMTAPDLALFAPGDRIRIYHSVYTVGGIDYGPAINEEHEVQSIAFPYLWTVSPLVGIGAAYSVKYQAGSRVVRLDPEALPQVGFPIDRCEPGSVTMGMDLRGSYSAVRITSVHTEQTTHTIPWDSGGTIGTNGSGFLTPAWDTDFEAPWVDGDADRNGDVGATGDGMEVYRITADTDSKLFLWVEYTETQHGSNHYAGEWNGTSLWVWTSAETNVRDEGHTFTIIDVVTLADVGSGNPGLRIKIDTTDIEAAIGGTFQTIADDTTGDRVVFSTDFRFETTTRNNARWEVGRKFTIEMEEIQRGDQAPHFEHCVEVKLNAYDGTIGSGRPMILRDPSRGYPHSNLQTAGPWEQLAGGGIGSFQVWRRSGYTDRPIVNQSNRFCGSAGYQPPPFVQVTIERSTTTLRQARYPASGYAGVANIFFNLERELVISTDGWTSDGQSSDYEELAERLWHLHQRGHHRGSLAVQGVREFGIWLDLAVRAQFYTTASISGGNTGITSFWGPLTRIVLDLVNDTVSIECDSTSPLASTAFQVWEDVTVTQASQISSAKSSIRRLGQEVNCLNVAPLITAPNTCAGQIRDGFRNSSVGGGKNPGSPKGQLPIAMGESGIAMDSAAPSGSASGSGGKYATHGPEANSTVTRDMLGKFFVIDAFGNYYPGSRSGASFTPSYSSTARPFGRPQENTEGIGALAGLLGLDPSTAVAPLKVGIASATTTTITLLYTGMATDEFANGTVEILDYRAREPRPPYEIASNTSDTLTLTGAMSETLPEANVPAFIWPKGRPRPSGFAAGAWAAKDTAGDWVVVEPDGSIYPATYVDAGPTLVLNSGHSGEIPLRMLGSEGHAGSTPNFTAGDAIFDFSAATVILPTPGASSEGATKDYVDSEVGSSIATAILKDGTVAFTGNQDLGGNKLTTVGLPSDSDDAATKGYVDSENATQTAGIAAALAATTMGAGASLVGIYDGGGLITATTVEGALAELATALAAIDKTYSWQVPVLGGNVRDENTGTLGAANPSIDSNTSTNGFTAYAGSWEDAEAGNRWAFQFETPSELDTSQAINAKVVFLVSTTGTGTVEIKLDARMVADDEPLNSGGSAPGPVSATKVATGYGTRDKLDITISNVFSGIAAGDTVKGCITRDSTGGSDDFTGTIRPIGLIFTGKRL